ncbi:hypothetical protein VNI00_018356 [Paramarasmius palmivorus]|uniref:Uncharacterized protein n=1 Tax=Paramarasmius palmivorus TaxID=297713 RepID=A0AAW0B2G9_9AGAR
MTRSRDRTSERRHSNLYFKLAISLFVLSTLFVVNYTVYTGHASVVRFNVVKNQDYDLFERYQTFDDFERRFGLSTEMYTTVFLNIAAEWMLIHRCYLIWGSSKVVAAPLIVASFVINACGLTSSILKSVGISTLASLDSNVGDLLMIEDKLENAYAVSSAVHNVVITLLTDLIIVNTIAPENISFDPAPLVALSAGMAPTLIMVRAKFGMNVESSMQEAISDIRFTDNEQGLGGNTARSRAQILSIVPNSGGVEDHEERAGSSKEASTIV